MYFKRQIVILLFLIAAVLAAGENLVENGDFSGGLVPWKTCAWNKAPGSVAVEDGALKISQDKVGQRTNVVQSLNLKPETSYRIVFRMKCEEVVPDSRGSGADLYVLIDSEKTGFHGSTAGRFRSDSGTFDWKEGDYFFTTPKEAGRCELYLQMITATGTVRFDDIRIYEEKAPEAKLKLQFYPAKFQGNTMNLVAGMPQTLLGGFFAEPKDAADMKLIIDLPPGIRFIGTCPWWWNEKGTYEPDPFTHVKITREGKEYDRYEVTLEKRMLNLLRKNSQIWNNDLRVFIEAEPETGEETGYFRLVSPRGGQSGEVALRFRFLPRLQKFEPTRRFTLGITELYNLTAPFPEVRETSLDLLFSLSRRPMTEKPFAWSKLPEERRKEIADRTNFVIMFVDNGFPSWREKNNWQEFRLDEGNGPRGGICPTYAAENFDSPYWQKFWLDYMQKNVDAVPRVDCIEWDVEPMVVCRCELCRDRFSKELQLDHTVTVPEIKEKYSSEFFRFRVRQNSGMIRNWAKLARANFPDTLIGVVTDNLHAAPPHISSWCGVDIRQFDDVFDVMRNMPYYSGLAYFDDFAFNMKTLKTPQFPLNDPAENLESCYIRYTPKSLLMNIIATAALGGKGFAVYPSEVLDGAYYHTLQKSTCLISRAEDYYVQHGEAASAEPKNVQIVEKTEENGEKKTAMIPDLRSHLRILVHDLPGKGRLLTIFNYAPDKKMILEIPAQGRFRRVRDIGSGELFGDVDGSKPFLTALEPESVKLLEFTEQELPGMKVETQAALQKELDRFFSDKTLSPLRSQRSGNFYAGWSVGRSGAAVAELSDGVSSVAYAPGKNGVMVSWKREGKDIVENSIGAGMLDDWLFHAINEPIPWQVTHFAAAPDKAEMTMEAELPPPRNADPDEVSLQGIKLKKTITLRNGEVICRGGIINTKSCPVDLAFRIRNYPQMSLPWKILSGGIRYNNGGEATVTALREGRQMPFAGRCLNGKYDGAPFEIATPDGTLLVQAPSADGILVWTSENSPSTVEPCFVVSSLPPGEAFTFETTLNWRK